MFLRQARLNFPMMLEWANMKKGRRKVGGEGLREF
jgi:hypothetical protein